jgi:hypothetical protein
MNTVELLSLTAANLLANSQLTVDEAVRIAADVIVEACKVTGSLEERRLNAASERHAQKLGLKQ